MNLCGRQPNIGSFTLYETASEAVSVVSGVRERCTRFSDLGGRARDRRDGIYDWGGFTVIDPEGDPVMGTPISCHDVATATGAATSQLLELLRFAGRRSVRTARASRRAVRLGFAD